MIMLTTSDKPFISGDMPESDNETLRCLGLCCHCHRQLIGQQRRFCSHACYSASLRLPVAPRFWSHVNKNGPIHPVLGTRCWLWTANVVGHGNKNRPLNSRHGQFTYSANQRQHHVYAHRFAWELTHGPIPYGLHVLHRCDVPPCVNTAHHFLGTQDDNMKDAAAKKRLSVPHARTLSLFDRLTIYHAPYYRGIGEVLAREYGVSSACISFIRRGRFIGSPVSVQAGACEVERVIRMKESA